MQAIHGAQMRLQKQFQPSCRVGSNVRPAAPVERASARRTLVRATPDAMAGLDTNTLIAGGAALLAAAGMAFGFSQSAGGGAVESKSGAPAEDSIAPENAVLVFGAKGKTGRLVVQQLLDSGRTVVAAVRSAEMATKVFSELGLKGGPQPSGGALILRGAVDVTDAATITPELFNGISQVVIAMGAVAGRLPDGSFGYPDGRTPKDIEGKGIANILKTMRTYLSPEKRTVQEVLPMRSEQDLAIWERTFRMAVRPSEDGRGAVVTGSAEAVRLGCSAGVRGAGVGAFVCVCGGADCKVGGQPRWLECDGSCSGLLT